MYAAIQNSVGAIRNRALSNAYTKDYVERLDNYSKLAVDKIEACKGRVTGLRDAAVHEVQARRDAAVAFVQEYQDMIADVVKDRREAAAARVEQAKAVVGDAVAAKRQAVTAAVDATKQAVAAKREAAQAAVGKAKSALSTSTAALAETGLAYVVTAVAFSLTTSERVGRAARDVAPPALLSSFEARVEQVKPVAAKALQAAEGVDARLGGFGAALVTRVASGVDAKRQAEAEKQQPQGDETAETATA